MSLAVTYNDILDAAETIRAKVRRTPVETSRTLDAMSGSTLFLKAESLQRTGSFKFRGATNAVARLTPAQRDSGLLTFSSGNHAQALAAAGQAAGVAVTVVMPDDAPAVKRAATVGYGATVIDYSRDETTREAHALTLAQMHGFHTVPPYDHEHIIAGQGTAALELFEDYGEFEVLVVPCGGGGLLSGSALVAKELWPRCEVVGVEPEAGDDAKRSLESGVLQTVSDPVTLADGARTPSLGQLTFPIVQARVDRIETVSDDALIESCRLLWSRLKLVVEPTGALGLAAILSGKIARPGARIGVILSGGNVDLRFAARLGEPIG